MKNNEDFDDKLLILVELNCKKRIMVDGLKNWKLIIKNNIISIIICKTLVFTNLTSDPKHATLFLQLFRKTEIKD